jgi:hypothetical protein
MTHDIGVTIPAAGHPISAYALGEVIGAALTESPCAELTKSAIPNCSRSIEGGAGIAGLAVFAECRQIDSTNRSSITRIDSRPISCSS